MLFDSEPDKGGLVSEYISQGLYDEFRTLAKQIHGRGGTVRGPEYVGRMRETNPQLADALDENVGSWMHAVSALIDSRLDMAAIYSPPPPPDPPPPPPDPEPDPDPDPVYPEPTEVIPAGFTGVYFASTSNAVIASEEPLEGAKISVRAPGVTILPTVFSGAADWLGAFIGVYSADDVTIYEPEWYGSGVNTYFQGIYATDSHNLRIVRPKGLNVGAGGSRLWHSHDLYIAGCKNVVVDEPDLYGAQGAGVHAYNGESGPGSDITVNGGRVSGLCWGGVAWGPGQYIRFNGTHIYDVGDFAYARTGLQAANGGLIEYDSETTFENVPPNSGNVVEV